MDPQREKQKELKPLEIIQENDLICSPDDLIEVARCNGHLITYEQAVLIIGKAFVSARCNRGMEERKGKEQLN